MQVTNSLNSIGMKTKKRYIAFYKLKCYYGMPHLDKYGLMCTRTWWQCFKLGIRHIRQGKATFFVIMGNRPKKRLCPC